MLIIGTNERAIEFAREITSRPELGYKVVGFVDDDWSGIEKFESNGYNRCCNFSSLADFLRHSVVDEAAIYLPLRSYYENAAELVFAVRASWNRSSIRYPDLQSKNPTVP